MTRSQFQTLNRARWAKVRRQVLDRDGWRCVKCGKAGRPEVDHVLPLHLGGDAWALDNLQTLCRACHIQKTRGENRREMSLDEAAWQQLMDERWDEYEAYLIERHVPPS